MIKYYFEVLPAHPLPEPLESLSSYVNRLMYINRLTRKDFADLIKRVHVFKPSVTVDYELGRLEMLPLITGHSRALLTRTTLEEFMTKFVRTTRKVVVEGFLEDVLVPYQRYCPACVKEKPVYKLPWRFNSLQYCLDHSCELLDKCGYCGSRIEFLQSENGTCPVCRKQLGSCELIKADSHALDENKRAWNNILYMLEESEHPDAYRRLHLVGQVLRKLRQSRGITTAEMATRIGCKREAVATNIEGRLVANGEKYKHYEAFAATFGYTVAEAFHLIDRYFVYENSNYRFSRKALMEADNYHPRHVYLIAQELEKAGAEFTEGNFKSALGEECVPTLADPIAAMLIDAYLGQL